MRFFAHLILVLRLLKQPLPSYATNRILEAYVHVLEANDQDENLIAFYASCLEEESAVESYARFLLSELPMSCLESRFMTDEIAVPLSAFGPDSDVSSRHAALRKCLDHNLSLPAIARRTVTLILSSAISSPPTLPNSARAQAIDAYARVDERQLELIRSLEWLTAEKETYLDALGEANALTRYFLGKITKFGLILAYVANDISLSNSYRYTTCRSRSPSISSLRSPPYLRFLLSFFDSGRSTPDQRTLRLYHSVHLPRSSPPIQ